MWQQTLPGSCQIVSMLFLPTEVDGTAVPMCARVNGENSLYYNQNTHSCSVHAFIRSK